MVMHGVTSGGPAALYSNWDAQTVDAQVKWMQDASIDTIALQRFGQASATLFRGDAEIQDFGFGDDRAGHEKSHDSIFVFDHPAELASRIELLERLHGPRGCLRRT